MITFKCGACFHWVEHDFGGPVTIGAPARTGICFGAPPTARAVLDKHDRLVGQGNLRPILGESERACGAFIPRAAANDLMAQLPEGDKGN